jgi:ribonuclease VapC
VIVDSSALVAILLLEPERSKFEERIHDAPSCRISAANFVELSMVLEREFGSGAGPICEAFFRLAQIVVEPVTVEQAHLAIQAFRDYGKGRHPAGLNFGDCFAYALAKSTGEPLLFKGSHFAKTDVRSAV